MRNKCFEFEIKNSKIKLSTQATKQNICKQLCCLPVFNALLAVIIPGYCSKNKNKQKNWFVVIVVKDCITN